MHTEINTRIMQSPIALHKGSWPASKSTIPTPLGESTRKVCGNARRKAHCHAKHLVFREEGLQCVQVKQRQRAVQLELWDAR